MTKTNDTLTIHESGIQLVLQTPADAPVRLLQFAPEGTPLDVPEKLYHCFPLVEVRGTSIAGGSAPKGAHYIGCHPGSALRYRSHRDHRTPAGRKLEILQVGEGLEVVSHFQFHDGAPLVRVWTELLNRSDKPVGLTYVSSFALTGLGRVTEGDFGQGLRLWIPYNSWGNEIRWKEKSLFDLGWAPMSESTQRISFQQTGTWPCNGTLPLAVLADASRGTALAWQIEHSGSWHWELGTYGYDVALRLSGPTENENHWFKQLAPGERFASVTAAVGVVTGTVETAIQALTRYRRTIRRPSPDNEKLPVIFNDYFCLWGNPSMENLRPMIPLAAEIGCEVFCIDCGWYAEGSWHDNVGEWQPSAARYPGGIQEPIAMIRAHGMVPGLWLELEVMGIHCPLAATLPDDWFFVRHGRRVVTDHRYHLDFRHPGVIRFADEVIDRLVGEYGIGYIKMDYNTSAGLGTESHADSFGDGLLRHNRAYLAWMDRVFERYPELVIENCGSGGMRMTYDLLSRHSVQSISDQTDYRKLAYIAASVASAITPEQCGAWAYPLRDDDDEAVAVNMVNAMLLRMFVSGHLAELSDSRRALMAEAITAYKSIRNDIREGVPFWPLGMPEYPDAWLAYGTTAGSRSYLSLWNMGDETGSIALSLPQFRGQPLEIDALYPVRRPVAWQWHPESATLRVQVAQGCARVLRLIHSTDGGRPNAGSERIALRPQQQELVADDE